MYRPDFSDDEDGFSDDDDYLDFKERIKNLPKQNFFNNGATEAELRKQSLTELFRAIQYEREESIFNEDIESKINTDLENGWTPLLLACTTANFKIISYFLERGADINLTRESSTPLMILCESDSKPESDILSCVKLVLDKGNDVNAVNRKRKTAIMSAAQNGYLDIVKFLLPLTDKMLEDNQRWTVLFYAVDGNHAEMVEYLLSHDFDLEKKDLHGQTVGDIANANGYLDIVNLLPQDPENFQFFSHHFPINFEETFKANNHEKPKFANDVFKMLYGCKNEVLIPLFSNADIGLFEFLCLTEEKLMDIVQFPFQRRRILQALYKFHKKSFNAQSTPFVPKKEIFTNIDVSVMLTSYIRQIIAMEAGLKFSLSSFESDGELSAEEQKNLRVVISNSRKLISRLKAVTNRFIKETKQWDETLHPVDKITRNRWNIQWGNVALAVLITSSVTIWYKFK